MMCRDTLKDSSEISVFTIALITLYIKPLIVWLRRYQNWGSPAAISVYYLSINACLITHAIYSFRKRMCTYSSGQNDRTCHISRTAPHTRQSFGRTLAQHTSAKRNWLHNNIVVTTRMDSVRSQATSSRHTRALCELAEICCRSQRRAGSPRRVLGLSGCWVYLLIGSTLTLQLNAERRPTGPYI